MPSRLDELMEQIQRWCFEKRGRQTELAEFLGVHRSAVTNWFSKKHNYKPTAEQALAGTPSESTPYRGDDLAGSLGLLCVWGANLRETFGEDSPLAISVAATPATQAQPEDHLRALDRQVLQRTPIPAMARARDGLATRTDSRALTVSFHDPTLVRLEHAAKRHHVQICEKVYVR